MPHTDTSNLPDRRVPPPAAERLRSGLLFQGALEAENTHTTWLQEPEGT